ncbi:MAG: restriction endonuclease subunit S [Spirochaetales bacterium]|nr:restriction endonuclease subunit S [Spirochaetales bacterium]
MKTESLKNLITISKGKKHSETEDVKSNLKRIIRIDDLRNDENIVFTDDENGTEVDVDDVLIAWDGANAGTIGYGKRGYIGSTIARLRIINEIELNPIFLGKFLQAKYLYLRKTATGATIPHINRNALISIKIPLPPLEEQKRIASVLTRAEKLITKRKVSIKLLDDFLKSTFLEMFGDPVRNEKGWEKKQINEFATIRIGPFGSLLHKEDYIENGFPIINPSHIIDGKIVFDSSFTVPNKIYTDLSNYHLKKNDIVVARRGEIGRCGIVKTNTKLLCGTGSMFIRIKGLYPPVLLQYQLYKTSIKDFLESKAKGVTMKNLNSKTLGATALLFPPISLQNQFASIVEKVESIKVRYQQSLTELENLYGSVSQRAFKGELDLSRILIEEGLDSIEPIKAALQSQTIH